MKRVNTGTRRALCLALCLAVLLLLGGCDSLRLPGMATGDEVSAAAEPSSEVSFLEDAQPLPQEPYRIGLIQYEDDPGLDETRAAFIGRLEEWGWEEDQVTIDYRNAGGVESRAQSICEGFVSGGADMIVAISDPAAKAALNAVGNQDVVVLFAAATHARESFGLAVGGAAVTGTEIGRLAGEIVSLARQADGEMSTLGLLYRADDALFRNALADAREACAAAGVSVQEAIVPRDGNAAELARTLAETVDAVFTPAGGLEAGEADAVAQALLEAKKPWYTGAESYARAGALLALCPDYTALGCGTADLAVEIMAGREAAQLDVETQNAQEAQTYVNGGTLNALGAKLPQTLRENAYFI